MHISHEKVDANFFGLPTVTSRNGYEISLANFTVLAAANKLSRPLSQVASGALKAGKTVQANISMLQTPSPYLGFLTVVQLTILGTILGSSRKGLT